VSARLVHNGELEPLLAELLDVAIAVTGVAAGFIQLNSKDGNPSRVIAETGGVSQITRVSEQSTQHQSILLPGRSRVSFPDLRSITLAESDQMLAIAIASGFRGFQSTPLISRHGEMIGFITTLSHRPALSDDRDNHVLDLLSRQAADFIEWRMAGVQVSRTDARLNPVLDSVIDAIMTIDSHGMIQSANPASFKLFGFAPDSGIGQSIGIIMPEHERRQWVSKFIDSLPSKNLETFAPQRIDFRACHKDGSVAEIEMVLSAVPNQPLFTAVMRDVTERRAISGRLQQSDRLTSLGTLAAGLGHDMNNVLFPIRAHLNALSAQATVTAATSCLAHVKSIMEGVRYLQELADGLHYLVNDAGTSRHDGDGTRLATWWASTGALLSQSLPVHTDVKVAIRGDIPAVGVTAQALTQAVLNLFVNASEAITARGVGWQGRIQIAATAAPSGRSIILSVTDNGTGMPEAIRARALDMFFTTKSRGLGTGLGLALVSRVAKEAGGSVSVQSSEGTGTTISIELPFASNHLHKVELNVAISLADGRAAAFVQSALSARGVASVTLDNAAEADAWIVDPRVVTPHEALVWKMGRRGRKVVLFGKAHRLQRQEWRGLIAGAVERAEDFEDLLVGVDRAYTIINGVVHHG
jgi:PAS domain S-box-containing protein